MNGAHGDSFAAGVAADGQCEETNNFRQDSRGKVAGSYPAGYRNILHRGVLAAVTGQDTSSLAGLLMDLFSVECRVCAWASYFHDGVMYEGPSARKAFSPSP